MRRVIGAPLIYYSRHRNPEVPSNYTKDMAISDTAVHDFDITRWLLGEELSATRDGYSSAVPTTSVWRCPVLLNHDTVEFRWRLAREDPRAGDHLFAGEGKGGAGRGSQRSGETTENDPYCERRVHYIVS